MSVFVGQVKWFNMKAGYGFINVRNGEHTGMDLFVHYTSVKVANPQYRYLIAGEYVQFNVDVPADGKHNFHAVNVTGIENGPLMCEARRDAAATAVSTTTDKPARRPPRSAQSSDQDAAASAAAVATTADGSFSKVSRKSARPSRKRDAKPSA